MKRKSLMLMLMAILFGIAKAQVQPLAKPADEGMSVEQLNRIDTVMNNHVRQGKIPGAVVLVARHGKVVYYKSFGKQDIESGKTMPTNAEFRIASMSKAITRQPL